VIAHDLHEVQHFEAAGELEADDVVAVDRHEALAAVAS
jgi:hypothetical protein